MVVKESGSRWGDVRCCDDGDGDGIERVGWRLG